MSAVDWAHFGAQHWNESPVQLRGVAESPDVQLAYEAVVAAAEPFRAGTRFRALPNVRFFVDGGQIRAPGDLLPGTEDLTADHYATRMAGRKYLLTVEQPLLLDFRLWSQVRDLVAPLWRQVGCPRCR